MTNNIGRVITDFFCNGYFGRDYDLEGSIIIAEAPEWIVIRKPSGIIAFASFQQVKYLRDDKGNPIRLVAAGVDDDKQEFIDRWCK